MAGNPTEESQALEQARREVFAWSDLHNRPIMTALFDGKLDQARQLIEQARQNTDFSAFSETAAEIIGYLLAFTECRYMWHPLQDGWTKASFEAEVKRFRQPARTEPGEQQRLRILLQILWTAHKDGYYELTREEILELVDRLPLGGDDSQVWHSIAGWAFHHDDMELIERAFESLLTNPGRELNQAKWQRVNLMYLLMTGKACRQDVYESIRLLEIKPQLQEFTNEIWPAIEQAGLVDEELTTQLAERAEKIASTEDHPPRRERRTKSIRNRP